MNTAINSPCHLCPRDCGTERSRQKGYCQCGADIKLALAAPHLWEEPCISGTRGSGAVFFSGCTLRCCYCQNMDISANGFGKEISIQRLAEIFLELQAKGVHNINLVTADMYLPQVLGALDMAKTRLHIPVVYNCSGYQRTETVRALKGYTDVYLPDLKYYRPELSEKYSKAANYFAVASQALMEMAAQTEGLVFDGEGMLVKGMIVRHLVLPGCRNDSIALLRWLADSLSGEKFMLSLMCQYTPINWAGLPKALLRRVTSLEYDSVVNEAVKLGLTRGYMQKRGSAQKEYTPHFDLNGV
jgi:putative pyruvate formate lyase activating enzyme